MGNNAGSLGPQAMYELVESTDFCEQEIRKWYKEFLTDYPTGYVSIDQFKDVYIQHFPGGDATKFAEHVFRTFDHDHNHMLDFREFLTGLSVTGKGSPKDRLRWAFRMYDIDDNGSIAKEECTEIIKAMYRLTSDQVVHEQVEQSCSERVDNIFELVDIDKDGKISEEEFVNGICMDPLLMHMVDEKSS